MRDLIWKNNTARQLGLIRLLKTHPNAVCAVFKTGMISIQVVWKKDLFELYTNGRIKDPGEIAITQSLNILDAKKISPDEVKGKTVIFIEHLHSRIEEQKIISQWQPKEIIVLNSFDDAIFNDAGTEKISALMDKLNYSDDEIIENSLIGSSIERLQKKYDTDHAFESQVDSTNKSSANWLNTETLALLSFIPCVWYLLYPHPRAILFAIVICLPLLTLFFNFKNRRSSENSLEDKDGDNGPSNYFEVFTFIPATVLLIRFLFIEDSYQHTLDYGLLTRYFEISGIVFIIYTALLLTGSRNIARKKISLSQYSFIAIIIFVYSAYAVYGANYLFDTSNPPAIHATINAKRISYGSRGSKFYHVKIKTDYDDFYYEYEVNKALYNSVEEGTPVTFYHKYGLLNLPWTYIELNK